MLFSSQASHSRGPLGLIGGIVSSSALWDPCSVVDAVNTCTSPEICGPFMGSLDRYVSPPRARLWAAVGREKNRSPTLRRLQLGEET